MKILLGSNLSIVTQQKPLPPLTSFNHHPLTLHLKHSSRRKKLISFSLLCQHASKKELSPEKALPCHDSREHAYLTEQLSPPLLSFPDP